MDARYTEGIVKCINSRALVPCKGKIGRKCLKDRLPVELRKQTNEVLLALNSLDDDAFVKQIAALLDKAITPAERWIVGNDLARHGRTKEERKLGRKVAKAAARASLSVKGLGKDRWGAALLIICCLLHVGVFLSTTSASTAAQTNGADFKPDTSMVFSVNSFNSFYDVLVALVYSRECTVAGKVLFHIILVLWPMYFPVIKLCRGKGVCADVDQLLQRLEGTCNECTEAAWSKGAGELWSAVKGMFYGSWGERKAAIIEVRVSLVKLTTVNKFADKEWLVMASTCLVQSAMLLLIQVILAHVNEVPIASAFSWPSFLNLTVLNTVFKDMLGAWLASHQCAMGGRLGMLVIAVAGLGLLCILGIMHWAVTWAHQASVPCMEAFMHLISRSMFASCRMDGALHADMPCSV